MEERTFPEEIRKTIEENSGRVLSVGTYSTLETAIIYEPGEVRLWIYKGDEIIANWGVSEDTFKEAAEAYLLD